MGLSERDKAVLWHPYTQAGSEDPALPIIYARGSKLYTEDGKEIIDAISSWWVNLHGHSHPYIAKKIAEQAALLEHVIFAGFTHKVAIELAEKLISVLPKNQSRVFYSDNGSTAVEVAIKMAIQYFYNLGEKRKRIIALEGAYHGDTFGAMALGGSDDFTSPFVDLLFEVTAIPFPSFGQENASYEALEAELKKGDVAAFILEPLIQGSSGMRIYSPNAVDGFLRLTKEYGVLSIFDEVFTGFGRTGELFASDFVFSKPDIICLSKALTGGFLPLGVTTATEEIYKAFLSDSRQHMFLHGHSFTGNPLACAAALASLELLSAKEAMASIHRISEKNQAFVEELKLDTRAGNPRSLGTILAFNLGEDGGYYSGLRDKLMKFFISEGVLLRPLGNVVYSVPPLCISDEELSKIFRVMSTALIEIY